MILRDVKITVGMFFDSLGCYICSAGSQDGQDGVGGIKAQPGELNPG